MTRENPTDCWDGCDCEYCSQLREEWILENAKAIFWMLHNPEEVNKITKKILEGTKINE